LRITKTQGHRIQRRFGGFVCDLSLDLADPTELTGCEAGKIGVQVPNRVHLRVGKVEEKPEGRGQALRRNLAGRQRGDLARKLGQFSRDEREKQRAKRFASHISASVHQFPNRRSAAPRLSSRDQTFLTDRASRRASTRQSACATWPCRRTLARVSG